MPRYGLKSLVCTTVICIARGFAVHGFLGWRSSSHSLRIKRSCLCFSLQRFRYCFLAIGLR